MIKPMAFLALYKLISRGYIQATIAKKAKKKKRISRMLLLPNYEVAILADNAVKIQ